jgi:4-amino-4-deoxy-L-arabinose transferase-like glycosyltransferase
MISRNWETVNEFLSKHWRFLILVVFGIGAICLFWNLTPNGVGVSHDSLFYLDAAENVARGKGVYWTGSGGELKPLSHFPPAYPTAIALPILFGVETLESARVLGGFVFGLNFLLVGYFLLRVTNSLIVALLASMIILGSGLIFEMHVWAMSEPLFFTWLLLSFILLLAYFDRGDRTYILLAALASSLTVLTRYIGITLLGTAIISILILPKLSFRRRFLDATIFSAAAGAPIGLWILRNWRLTGSATNRTLQVHLIDVDTLRSLLDVIFNWYTQATISHWIEGGILLLFFSLTLGYLGWRLWIRAEVHRRELLGIFLLTTFSLFYILQVLFSLSFFDAATRIDDRIFSPIFMVLWLIIFLLILSFDDQRIAKMLALVFLVLITLGPASGYFEHTIELSRHLQSNSFGFNSAGWQRSKVIQWIREQPETATIISNQAMAVGFLTHTEPIQLPESWGPVRNRERPEFQQQRDEVLQLLQRSDTYLVLFNRQDFSRDDGIDWSETLSKILDGNDGSIYALIEH